MTISQYEGDDAPNTDTIETADVRPPVLRKPLKAKQWDRLRCNGCGGTYFGGARSQVGSRNKACKASPAGRFH